MCQHKLDDELICKKCLKPFRKVGFAQIVRVVKGLSNRQKAAILYQRYLVA